MPTPNEGPVMRSVHYIIDWIQDRLRERTSWDGLTIIVISVLALAASPLIKYAAWAGLAYGVWTLWRTEKPAKRQ
jgi:hypothetical protein